jgi:hypothetical protein
MANSAAFMIALPAENGPAVRMKGSEGLKAGIRDICIETRTLNLSADYG